MLAQFGVLGAAYDRAIHGRARPRVGLLANGTEPGKGTELTRAAAPLLAAAAAKGDFRFVGYVEGSGIWDGAVDVVATDGFTGNVVLKACEGVATALFGLVRQRLDRDAARQAGRRAGGAGAARSRPPHRLRRDRRRAPGRRRRRGGDRPRQERHHRDQERGLAGRAVRPRRSGDADRRGGGGHRRRERGAVDTERQGSA
jgi:hypothetical protein